LGKSYQMYNLTSGSKFDYSAFIASVVRGRA
jgi:hypothetical protein